MYGTVYNANGNPMPDVTVKLENPAVGFSRATTTASDGSYSFAEVPPAEGYQIAAFLNGRKVDERKDFAVQVGEEYVVHPALQETVDARPRKAVIYGKVYNAAHQPVAGVTVKLENAANGYSRTTVTDAGGAFRFSEIPPAAGYDVITTRNGKVTARNTANTAKAGEESRVGLVEDQLAVQSVQAASVEGTLPPPEQTQSGSPGTILVASNPHGAQVYLDDAFRGQTAQSDGRLVLDNVTVGRHILRVSQPGFADSTQDVTVVAGGRQELGATLERTGPQPLTYPDIQQLLSGGVSNTRVSVIVRERGVNFALTDEQEAQLRKLGADDKVILAIMKNKK